MRCQDFYRRWEEEPNWCEKCRSSVSLIDRYIRITQKLIDVGADKDLTYVKFNENTSRVLRGIPEETMDKMLPTLSALINNPTIDKISDAQLRSLELQMVNPNSRKKYPIEMPSKIFSQAQLQRNIRHHTKEIEDYREKIKLLEEELIFFREQLNKIMKSKIESTEPPERKHRNKKLHQQSA